MQWIWRKNSFRISSAFKNKQKLYEVANLKKKNKININKTKTKSNTSLIIKKKTKKLSSTS